MTASEWLTDHAELLPSTGLALDLACGRGRHALWLAERGLRTCAVDRDPEAVGALNDEARARGLLLEATVVDLESGDASSDASERGGGNVGSCGVGSWGLAVSSYDVIVAFSYLYRPLFPRLVAALRPGGVLVYETFTVEQAAYGKPTNPAFLLKPGELRELVQPLEILAEREGEFGGRMIASVIARLRPSPPRLP